LPGWLLAESRNLHWIPWRLYESVDKLLTRRQVGRIFNPPLELSILAVMMAD
jgi:hypothetical protein